MPRTGACTPDVCRWFLRSSPTSGWSTSGRRPSGPPSLPLPSTTSPMPAPSSPRPTRAPSACSSTAAEPTCASALRYGPSGPPRGGAKGLFESTCGQLVRYRARRADGSSPVQRPEAAREAPRIGGPDTCDSHAHVVGGGAVLCRGTSTIGRRAGEPASSCGSPSMRRISRSTAIEAFAGMSWLTDVS